MKKLNDSEKRVYKRVCKELKYALGEMQDVKKAVSLFGSARISSRHPYAKQAEEVAECLSGAGYAVITGGGPGCMEGANRGCKHTESIGLAIKLPHEQGINPHVTKAVHFKYFAIRKLIFIKYAKAIVVCPGGAGSLDEFFEVFTLVQTKVIPPLPIILVNEPYWRGLLDWLHNSVKTSGIMTTQELKLIKIVNSGEEVIEEIKKYD
jgi:uncharacterized protein (TIGR00730 family)